MKKTPEQQAAVDSNAQRILVVASPGSGKTATIAARITRLLTEGADPSRMVCITFTNAGATELASRIAVQHPGVFLSYIGTLHGYMLRIVNRNALHRALRVIDEEQGVEQLRLAAEEMRYKLGKEGIPKALEEAGKRHYTPAGKRDTSKESVVIGRYYSRLRVAGLCDFDSLLQLGLQSIKADPVFIEHLFVDEFQDSALIDAQIYEALEVTGTRCFVGDPDQAIYGFRGGAVRLINDMAEGDIWRTYRLEHNFRSAPEICAAAQRLIERSSQRVDKRTLPTRPPGGTVTPCYHYGADTEEATAIAATVKRCIAEGTPPEEIAVLARRNSVINAIADMVEVYGSPVARRAKVELPPDWREARMTLELLADPFNPTLQAMWLRAKLPGEAEGIIRTAASEQTTPFRAGNINWAFASHFPWPEALARNGISRASIDRLQSIAAELVNPTPSDVSLAIAQAVHSSKEIGAGVTCTTCHSSKGREWKTVIIAGCEAEQFDAEGNEDENRRLFFVAMTRAKDTLHFTRAQYRRQTYGRKEMAPTNPSRFLDDIA